MKLTPVTMACAVGVALLIAIQQLPVGGHQATPTDDPHVVHAHRPTPAEENVVTIPVAGTTGDLANQRFMHAKLRHSREIFAGLVLRDFGQIESGAVKMAHVALDTPGVEPGSHREDEVFAHMNLEFRRLAERLQEVAQDQNLEGAAYVNEKLNATCISCHQYLRDVPTHIHLQ